MSPAHRACCTAVGYSNDLMALAGLSVAQRAGLRVPDDLSITGFDNTELGEHTFPSITSVATDATDWGARSARLLLAAIAQQPAENIDLPEPRLVVRESTTTAPDPNPRGIDAAL
jgi:DNA-binding LacI/PurR family transcriptional regulator